MAYPAGGVSRLVNLPNGRQALLGHRFAEGKERRTALWIISLAPEGSSEHQTLIPLAAGQSPAAFAMTPDDGVALLYGKWTWSPPLRMHRLDANGGKMWLRDLPGFDNRYRASITSVAPGGFLLAGPSEQFRELLSVRTRIERLDAEGRSQWVYEPCGLDPLFAMSSSGLPQWEIATFASGQIVVMGSGGWLLRLTACGDRCWDMTLPGIRSMVVSLDESVIVAGDLYIPKPVGAFKNRLMRITQDGEILWRREPVFVSSPIPAPIIETIAPTPDGGALILLRQLWTLSQDENWMELLLARYDAEGARLWLRTVVGNDQPRDGRPEHCIHDAAVTADGQVLVLGSGAYLHEGRVAIREWLRILPFD